MANELQNIELRNDNETDFFVSFYHEDGEENLIRANLIMLMESVSYYPNFEENVENQ